MARHLSPLRIVVLALLGLFVLLAIAGPPIWGHKADAVDLAALNRGASFAHPFGTDALGRDLFARVMVAARASLLIALVTAALGFAGGVLLGMLPLVLGRRARRALMSLISLLVAFPGILLVLLVVTIVGVGIPGMVVALAVAGAPQAARVTQTLAASVNGLEYVSAARVVGVRWPRLLARHVLPNVAPPLVLLFAQAMGAALIASSALSFLGIGVQEPHYDWGALLNVGLERVYVTPAAALGPAAVIVLAALALNVAGDTIAGVLAGEPAAPRRRRRRERSPAPAAVPEPALSVQERLRVRDHVLHVDGLSVEFPTVGGTVRAVRDVDFVVRPGERVGIVGESGSGKTLTALAVADLIEAPGATRARLLRLDGIDPRTLPSRERARLFATSLAMVFQDPLSSLNPALRNGTQITEVAQVHGRMSAAEARGRAVERLRELGISAAERRLRHFPHELSGGMRQRAVIAMGLMTEPWLIVADEPTTALDVTVQRQVLRALRTVNAQHGTAIVLISHDISVVASFCQRVLVMYGGRVVEEIAADRLDEAAHPYSRALLAAVPDMDIDRDAPLATIPGRPPAVDALPHGCAFAPRCPRATDRCRAEAPPLAALADGRVACWHPQVDAGEPVLGAREGSA